MTTSSDELLTSAVLSWGVSRKPNNFIPKNQHLTSTTVEFAYFNYHKMETTYSISVESPVAFWRGGLWTQHRLHLEYQPQNHSHEQNKTKEWCGQQTKQCSGYSSHDIGLPYKWQGWSHRAPPPCFWSGAGTCEMYESRSALWIKGGCWRTNCMIWAQHHGKVFLMEQNKKILFGDCDTTFVMIKEVAFKCWKVK